MLWDLSVLQNFLSHSPVPLPFFTLIGVQNWQVILALVIGGVIAAPIAAKLAGKLPRKASFILLGTVVVIWSIKILAGLF
jgi:uncharacterized membrane protein YfcA